MLITNFSAGELSDKLFGRTDLSQYYSAASFLENFDVIPTGGVENRPGTKKILQLEFDDGEGGIIKPVRVVPFILSRDEAYLVVFFHEKIAVYRVGKWDEPKKIFTNADISNEFESKTLYTAEEIPLVQHAQNFRTMVLAHKNHPPLQIDFFKYGIFINIFFIGYMIKRVHSPNLIPLFPRKRDETYEDEQTGENIYLKKPEQYPGCVTFLNGRIVFASTNDSGQRLFFSRIDDIHDFSTYKSYITEKKEYIAPKGKIINGSYIIELDSGVEAEKFTATPDKYIIDSMFFPPDTRLLSVPYEEDGVIKLNVSEPATIAGTGLNDYQINEVKEALRTFSEEYTSRNSNMPTVIERVATHPYYSNGHINTRPIHIKIGVSKVYLWKQDIPSHNESIEISADMAQRIDNGTAYNYLYNLINNAVVGMGGDNNSVSSQAINTWMSIITQYMKFQRDFLNNGQPYYDTMPNIRIRIESTLSGTSVYIPMYTSEQIKDDYPTADDGFTFEVASDRNDEIRWMVQNKNLIVGTESAEYVIPSNISAVNPSAFLNSFYGSSKIQASSAGDAVMFFRDGQRGLVEYHIPEADNYFRTNDLLSMAPQMLRESEAADFDVVTMPYTKLVITRKDGTLAVLLYDRSFGIFAWMRISLGSGEARSLAVVPGKSGYDEVYLLVEKDGGYCLELLEHGGKVYLDSYKQWDGDRSGYTNEAVIWDEDAPEKVYNVTGELPAASVKRWIGYPYTSRVKSMPILANNKMKPTVIKNLLIRFHESFLPKMKSYPNKVVDQISTMEPIPFTGIKKAPFPGVYDRDVMFEFIHEKPNRCSILAINAEVN